MARFRHIDPADLPDALLGAVAVAYIVGFVAAIEAALGRLAY